MEFNKIKEKLSEQAIIHFWNLSNKIYVILDSKFKEELMEEFMIVARTKYNANKVTGIQRETISNIINKTNPTIRIDYLFKIIKVVNKKEFNLESVEKHIIWIGDFRSQGVINPKLPFNFNYREGARFIAAICNEGWISDGMYYSNSRQELRDSVKADALNIFGGDKNTIKEWVKEKDQYLAFPSIMRDIIILITDFKGVKSENNPPIPSFIFKDENLILGWIEQTIADEGHVKYYPKTYRREIIWRRSFSRNLKEYKLNRDEMTMLDKIGIEFDSYDIGTYKTKIGIEKVRLQIRIAKRENLLKLRELIRIPHKRKDKIFTELTKSFVRYKEPLKIKDAIIKIFKENGFVTSSELRKEMNYKKINTANKWVNIYRNNGLLKCTEKSSYGSRFVGKIPAKYVLNEA